jgi:phosphoenolpyruvate carboxylase
MSDPQRLLSTQHPVTASPPPFSESDLLGPAAEVISAVQAGDEHRARAGVAQAARHRRFLG